MMMLPACIGKIAVRITKHRFAARLKEQPLAMGAGSYLLGQMRNRERIERVMKESRPRKRQGPKT